ncbi:hypothetical protein F4810DRAFT_708801 [Camillea tinctor]|nr:hypothetical protein F4810DRAFT_708801 [Camillea tinctor]
MAASTTDNMSFDQQSQALQHIKENQIRQSTAKEYVDNLKNSLMFRPGFNWNDLLSAAPVSISLLGSLFVASTIPDALAIKIIAPVGGFKTLPNFDGSDPSLNACLISCSDKGVQAFGVAASAFDAISQKSGTIKVRVRQLVEILGDVETAKTSLVPTIQTIAKVADDCKNRAMEVENEFKDWLEMVCELHTCVVQTSSDASEKQAANQSLLAAAKTRLAGTKEVKDEAAKNLGTLQETLKTATAAYKKAADEFPTGWDLIGQQFISDLGESFTNALNLAVPALIESYSLTAKIDKGVNIFTGNNGGVKGGSVGDGKADHSAVQPAVKAPPAVPQAVTPYPNDPAYGVIGPIRNYVASIRSFMIGGPNNGVDWELLTSKDHEKQSNSIEVLMALLADAKKTFKPSTDPPSVTLLAVLDDVIQVAEAIKDVIKDSKNINGKPLPANDSEVVNGWKVRLGVDVQKTVELETASKNNTTGRGPPLINQPQLHSSPTDKRGAFRQQAIDAAATKLNTTSQVMNTTTESFQKANSKLLEVQAQLSNIQAEISSLTTATFNLDKIKSILVKCIDILIQLKSQINRLVAFFSAVSDLINTVVDDQVMPFIDFIKSGTMDDKTKAVLNFTFTDLQRQVIFSFALNTRAYFELFGEISGMYLDTHNQFISKGLELVNDMQSSYRVAADDQQKKKPVSQILAERSNVINTWSKNAIAGVKDMAVAFPREGPFEPNRTVQRQAEIMASLQEQATNAANEVQFIPVRPSPMVTKAIENSSQASKDAAAKGIEESSKYLTRPFSSTKAILDDF